MSVTAMSVPNRRPSPRTLRLAKALGTSELFGDLGQDALGALAEHAELLSVPGGQRLIQEGATGDDMFIVVSGRLCASAESGGGDDVLDEIGPGQVVGELSMLSRRSRAASVHAIRDSTLVRLSASGFERAVRQHPEVALALAPILLRRLERAAPHVEAPPRTIAVVGAGIPAPRLSSFTRELADQLGGLGPTTCVSSRAVARRFGSRYGTAEVSAWLQALEQQGSFVVYRADAGATEWTRRCLRQADRILLVADADADPRPGPAESLLRTTRAATELVLVRSPHTKPSRTAAWLALRDVRCHHHVEAGNTQDLARLARRLAGSAVALVLGGGGARGFAHLGVVRALEESGVPVDAVAGTSIGSIMGAGLAMGWDTTSLVETCMAGFVRTRFLVGITPPVVALSSAGKITRLLQRHFGDTAIEDLPVPYFCMSTSLTTGRSVVHDQGPLWEAVRASISLPGVLPPVCAGDDLLVDGSVLDDVPVAAMRTRVRGTIVSVELSASAGLRAEQPFPPAISGWRVLARRVRRHAPKLPSALEVLQASKEVAVRAAQPAAASDIVLRPPVDGCRSLDFRHADVLIEPAYRYAADVLSRRLPPAAPARSPVSKDASRPRRTRRATAGRPT